MVGLDAGSGDVSQHRVSSKTVRPRAPFGAGYMGHWGTLLECGPQFVQGRRARNLMKERDSIRAWTSEIPNTSPQAIKPNPSCLGKAQPNRPGTGYGYKSTEPGCTLTILRISSVICPLRSADA